MPRTTKDTAYSISHVLERALERYALVLTPADYDTLNTIITAARSESESSGEGCRFLGKENGDEYYGVRWLGEGQSVEEVEGEGEVEGEEQQGSKAGVELICVWNTTSARLTTLLPAGIVIQSRRRNFKRK